MKIQLFNTTVRDLTNDYQDNLEEGVVGFGGKLDIRPPYQREFVYKDKQRDAVINTVSKKFPLNVMYWAVRDDGNYEIIDGQQRTISVCQFVHSEFSFKNKYFHNLQKDEQEKILDYELTIYLCKGSDSEKLEWFKTINIAGEKLFDQELRNAVYHGSWVSDAKRYFSKTGCAAYQIGGDYVKGTPIRQDYLETAIKWINGDNIEEYMAQKQNEPTAVDLWNFFQNIISWVQSTFPKKRTLMKGVPWGELYKDYKDSSLDPKNLETETERLIADEDVTYQKGIYQYLLTRNEKFLQIRRFSDQVKLRVYEKQKGKCNKCGESFVIKDMDGDHIKRWVDGGKTDEKNCQMLCVPCNRGGN